MQISHKTERKFALALIVLSLFVLAGIKVTDCSLAHTKDKEAKKIREKSAKKSPEDKLIKAGLTKKVCKNPKPFTDEILVKTKTKTAVPSAKKLQALSLELKAEKNEKVSQEKWKTLRTTDGKSVAEKIKELEKDPAVSFAQPNYIYEPSQIDTNDSLRDMLWNLDNVGKKISGEEGKPDADIDAPESWSLREKEKEAIVAVIDTGVAFSHPDLAANMWDGANCRDENGNALGGCQHGYDFEGADKIPLPDSHPHGTMVAGTLAAVKGNGRGVIGAAPEVKIMALKTNFTTAQLVRAIEFAKVNGADIVNASWGAGLNSCALAWDKALYEALKDFPGLVVAAAGNNGRKHDGQNFYFFPADYSRGTNCWEGLSNVVSVAATDLRDNLAGFSDYGEGMIDVGAPGENVTTSYATFGYPAQDESGKDELYAMASGTSFAAPHAAGAAAQAIARDKNLSPGEIKEILLASGDPVNALSGKTVSGRRVNAFGVLNSLSSGVQKRDIGGTLSDIVISGLQAVEIVNSPVATIRIENPQTAMHLRLSKKAKIKKGKWIPVAENILARIKKNKKVQSVYMKFRDAEGNESPVYRKRFKYMKPKK